MDLRAYAAKAAEAQPMPLTDVPAPKPGLAVHIDGDYAAYYCSGNDDTEPGQARRNLLDRVYEAKRLSGATKAVMHLTDRASTKGDRFLVATIKPYQGQRGGRKPRNWEMLREYMEGYTGDKFTVHTWKTREADDGFAYVAEATDTVLLTADKDMRMLPGTHMLWKSMDLIHVPRGTFELIGRDGELYGHKWFWQQMLQGDTADNIPGLPKYIKPNKAEAQVGKATAASLLKDVHDNREAFRVVSNLYRGYYGEESMDRLVEQACLLWLRNDRDADLCNYEQIMPRSDEVLAAGERMRERVQQAKDRLKEFQ